MPVLILFVETASSEFYTLFVQLFKERVVDAFTGVIPVKILEFKG